MANAKEILATAIEMEHFGSEYYSKFEDLVASEKAKILFRSLAADEKDHAHILEIEMANLGGTPKPLSDRKLKNYLKQVFPESIHKDSIHAKDAISAIKLGIMTERRSIEFYTKHAARASPKMRKIFAKLIKMEIVHLGLLEENLQLLEDDGSWYGYLPILEG
ncbi:MAG: ferritin family protein [Candidatus Thermoplasmatota archaeon]|nr:ferritin family protein [Candidatus Thermoplasmatota archaeon]